MYRFVGLSTHKKTETNNSKCCKKTNIINIKRFTTWDEKQLSFNIKESLLLGHLHTT